MGVITHTMLECNMKRKISNIWYFIVWLLSDIKLLPSLMIINTLLIIVGIWIPEPYSKYIYVYILITYLIAAFFLFVVFPLKYSYKKFKDEQKLMFEKIKGDD
jgi:hypothetical protein